MTIKYYCCIILCLFFAIPFGRTEGNMHEVAVGEKQYKLHFPADLNEEELKKFIKEDLSITLEYVKSIDFTKVKAAEFNPQEKTNIPDSAVNLFEFRAKRWETMLPSPLPDKMRHFFKWAFEDKSGNKYLFIGDNLVYLYAEKYKEHVTKNNSLDELREFVEKMQNKDYISRITSDQDFLLSEVYVEDGVASDEVRPYVVSHFDKYEVRMCSVFRIGEFNSPNKPEYAAVLPLAHKDKDLFFHFGFAVYADKKWKIYVRNLE